MQYVITSDRPFDEIETQAIEALEHRGFVAGDGPARVITVYFPVAY